jgi:hypothetical protein
MSDFVNEFWNWYVILIVLVSIIACGCFAVVAKHPAPSGARRYHRSRLGRDA